MTYLKNIVITGASRGLGLEFVKQLCKTSSCHKIFASCRNPDNATELQKLADDHVQVVIKKLDVDNIDSFQPFVDEIEVFCFHYFDKLQFHEKNCHFCLHYFSGKSWSGRSHMLN